MNEIDAETGEVFEAPPVTLSHSPTIGAIGAAIAKAQSAIDNVLKEARNPHFNSKYADLGAILTEARPKVAACEIAIIQSPYNAGGDIGVETMLIHKSGEWIKGRLAVKPMKFDAQGAGSVITYLRRYSLASMLGIGSEDDDGEAAVGRPSAAAVKPAAAKSSTKPASEHPQAAEARGYYEELRGQIATAPHEMALDNVLKAGAEKLKLIAIVSPTGAEQLDRQAKDRREALRSSNSGVTLPI